MPAARPHPVRPKLPEPLGDLQRSPAGERWIGGVAGGVAERFGIDVSIVRIAFVALTFASGMGVAIYALGWLLLPEDRSLRRRQANVSLLSSTAGDPVSALAFGAIILGLMLLVRQTGLPFPGWIMWPILVVAVGASMASHESRRSIERALSETSTGSRRGRAIRLGLAGLLVGLGVAGVIGGAPNLNVVGHVILIVIVILVAVGIVLLPWGRSMLRALSDERRGRIRSEEKAEIAAHLHDSVLQTLAIIQRRADDPKQVQALARRQERELRAWLFNEGSPIADGGPRTIRTQMDQVVQEIEDVHGVNVDFVCVGDGALTTDAAVLVAAAREAMTNAGKHAQTDKIDVYLEVDTDEILAFVRDRGVGFDVNLVSPDRHGLSDSIIGRLTRAGGRATVHSAPGEGTEVQLSLPTKTATQPEQRNPADQGEEKPPQTAGTKTMGATS